ncbi:MAG: AarF/ABC1/UbiB kinase family protein [Acidimicrobiaceae bacterium]|nr:AarF/ABC1/UbiB kinase family protein [Acidimicrobiaceae bacterium]
MTVLLGVEVAFLLPIALGIGWLATRMLGARQTWARILVTGLIGWILGVALANWSVVNQRNHESTLELRVAAFSVLTTMGTSIGVDFVARPDRRDRYERVGRLPSVPRPVREIKRAIAPPRRFREVMEVARREGLLQRRFASATGIQDPEFGPRLRATLEGCGGMFVKLGQVAATRHDLFPEPVTAELTHLQSSAAPADPEAMRAVIDEELGGASDKIFATFDWSPVAAASIAQVYRATLPSGEPVVVKVQRPQVADLVARDTQAMLTVARFIQRRTMLGLRVDVVGFVHEFTDAVHEELDFSREARSAEGVRLNRRGDRGVHFPKVHLALCTRRLIVFEEVQGRPISDQFALRTSPVPRRELADRLLATYMGQILHDGVFHADPHPGNILLGRDGTLYLLDFGSTGILDGATLEGLGGIVIAMTLNDADLFQRAVFTLTPPPAGADMSRVSSDLSRFLAIHVQQAGGFDMEMLKAMIDLLQEHRFTVPPSLTLLARALLTLDGTLHLVAPGYPLAERVTAVAKPLLIPFRPTQVPAQLQREMLRTLPALRSLPGHAEAIASQLRSGHLSLRTRLFGDPSDASFVRDLINRALLTAVGLIGILTSAIILLASTRAPTRGDETVMEGIAYIGLFLGSIVTMRVVALIVRDRSA